MENIKLINLFPEDKTFTYRERVSLLRERKIEQTLEKADHGGADDDDFGSYVPPSDFSYNFKPNHPNGSFYGYEGWADNFIHMMEIHPIYIDPLDAFFSKNVDKLFINKLKGVNWNPDYPLDEETQQLVKKYNIITGVGGSGHFVPDLRIGFKLGWGGILEKLKQERENHGEEHHLFYDSELRVVEAVIAFHKRIGRELRELETREQNPQLKENLGTMATVMERIAEHPPETFREAVQWMCVFSMLSRLYNRGPTGGHIDQMLLPYYERDTQAGKLTDDEARFYLACLYLQDSRYYQISGRHPETGDDLTNHLSSLCLDAADWIDVSCNLAVRVHDKMDPEFLYTAVNYLFKNKNGWPRFCGDNALTQGFMRNGFTEAQARERISAGCHWFCTPGLEYPMNDLPKINVARVFEVAFNDMMDGAAAPSINLLWKLFSQHLEIAVGAIVTGIKHHLKYQSLNEPELLCNPLMVGPVEKGLNITDGAAVYYNICIDGCGIAVVADSLAALEQRVEHEKKLTYPEVARHLKENYEGIDGEYTRQMMLHSERYCGGGTRGDDWGVKLTEELTRLVRARCDEASGIRFIPGWFSWSNTISFGRAVGATPNGRKAFEPINHGANPTGGFRKDGAVTALSNTIASVQPGYGNTAPVQLELDPGLALTEDAVWKMVHMIQALLDSGNTLLNINIIDAKKILDAHKDPKKYPDLVVRVTGFSAYFAMLTPEFRQLVVDRILAVNGDEYAAEPLLN